MKEIMDYLKQDISILVHIGGIVLLTFIAYFIINRTINKFIDHYGDRDNFDTTNAKFLRRIISAVIFLIGFGFVIFFIPSLRHVATTLLAGAGVIVAVIGFSSQQVLANIISGIMIVVTKPYRINDRIALRNVEGIIEDITLRHTVIKNYENKRIIIPNSIMSSEVITNANFTDDICCEWVELSVAYTADIKKAKDLMKDEMTKHPLFIDHRNKKQKDKNEDIAPVRVMSVGDFSIVLRAWTWAANPADAFLMGCDLRESIKERFDKEGIEIPYPYNNVILKN
ncbi:mechanosensitive ion channel family protein [Maribacter sp. ACAM166]|uniref:mechanosensitive ion channel family protein n=1 Tax=Maribacter sp. ACAM166 TaxID=2508996 RepID=UPI0010FEACCC|nr:mechanosensitive ion channel domain-containing protein [Maribacter sp. ACAM166]TLP70698.1 mechanosensitive ion channel [Maribacter sp. ACAM166]